MTTPLRVIEAIRRLRYLEEGMPQPYWGLSDEERVAWEQEVAEGDRVS